MTTDPIYCFYKPKMRWWRRLLNWILRRKEPSTIIYKGKLHPDGSVNWKVLER